MPKSNIKLFAFFWLAYFFFCPYCEYKVLIIRMIYGKNENGFGIAIFLMVMVD